MGVVGVEQACDGTGADLQATEGQAWQSHRVAVATKEKECVEVSRKNNTEALARLSTAVPLCCCACVGGTEPVPANSHVVDCGESTFGPLHCGESTFGPLRAA